jgi:hypothetical protein
MSDAAPTIDAMRQVIQERDAASAPSSAVGMPYMPGAGTPGIGAPGLGTAPASGIPPAGPAVEPVRAPAAP